MNFNDEFKKRLIENNFDLMNGQTIQVTTDKEIIPKYFMPIDNIDGMKQAVAHDIDQNNIGQLLGKRKDRGDE